MLNLIQLHQNHRLIWHIQRFYKNTPTLYAKGYVYIINMKFDAKSHNFK